MSTEHGRKIDKQLVNNHVFEHLFAFDVAKTANVSQINQQCYSSCPAT